MNTRKLILLFVLLSLPGLAKAQSFDYDSAWYKIESFELDGLPASARGVVSKIEKQAQKTQNYPQFVKAFIYKMKYRNLIEDTEFSQILRDAEKMMDSVPSPVQCILHSMVGEMYQWYYQNNRYKFYGRSTMTSFEPTDIATWDLRMIARKMITHYRLSVKDSAKTKLLPMSLFGEIINEKNYDSTHIHPTLYDFLAFRGIDFFLSQDPGYVMPDDGFSMDNEAYFLPADRFVQLTIENPDTMSFKYNAILFLHDLLRNHIADSIPENAIDIDLKRLAFVNGASTSSEKDSLYLNSLLYLENISTGRTIAATIGLLIAEKRNAMGELYNAQVSPQHRWDKKLAVEKCQELIAKYPNEKDNYNRLIASIKTKNIAISIEHENIPNEPFRAFVAFKNTDTVFLRIIPTTIQSIESLQKEYQTNHANEKINWNEFLVAYLKNQRSTLNYHVIFPNSYDYQKHSTEIKIPALTTGYYYIVASTDSLFNVEKCVIVSGITCMTNLSYINRLLKNGSSDFYVLNRKTGEPIMDVRAECFVTNYNYTDRKNNSELLTTFRTDPKGFFNIPSPKNKSFYIDFSYHNEQWTSRNLENGYIYYNSFNSYQNNQDTSKDFKTFFFTDRSLYRPGQTLYFKGIVIETDEHKYNKLETNFKSTVTFRDVNNQIISELKLTTNEFGSFNGSFMIPKTGMTGEMTLEDDNGSVTISVEDYKRPTFEIKFDSLNAGYKLEEDISVPGVATSYAGAHIAGASVKYRVVRQTQFDNWWYWWRPRPNSPEKEMTHGIVATDSLGKFSILFKAIPDVGIATSLDPTFSYTIYVDVTDINGETHSVEKNIRVGYKALLLDIDVPQRLDRNDVDSYTIQAKNLNGDNVPATGQMIIQKLKNPDHIFRERKWDKPDVFMMSRDEYYKNFPNDPYDNELDFTTWDIENIALETTFDTKKSQKIAFTNLKTWNPGVYGITLKSKDKYGSALLLKRYFTVYDKKGTDSPYPQTDWFQMIKDFGEPGEFSEFVAGTSYENARVLVEVETQDGVVQSDWISLNKKQHLFSYPLKESYRGNIGIHYTFIRNNRLYTHTSTVVVPFSNKMLQLKFATFRNKLEPGNKEQWKLTIQGKGGEKVGAEMVATMYDASLDIFKPHTFDFSLWPSFYPQNMWGAGKCFDVNFLNVLAQTNTNYSSRNLLNHYQLNWFGFGYKIYQGVVYGKNHDNQNNSFFKIIFLYTNFETS